MKQILVMMAAVVLVGCGEDTLETSQTAEAEPQVASKPTPEPVPPTDEKLIADAIFERQVRISLPKPVGELTAGVLGKVTELGLWRSVGTEITDEVLKKVAKLQNLKKLGLTHYKITDAGLKEVAKLQKLSFLHLNNTKITDAGLMEVAKLQKLGFLYLLGTKVTKEGVAELKKALPNCKIEGP